MHMLLHEHAEGDLQTGLYGPNTERAILIAASTTYYYLLHVHYWSSIVSLQPQDRSRL